MFINNGIYVLNENAMNYKSELLEKYSFNTTNYDYSLSWSLVVALIFSLIRHSL